MSRYRAARPRLAWALIAAATLAFGCGAAGESTAHDDDAGSALAVDADAGTPPANPGVVDTFDNELWEMLMAAAPAAEKQ